MTPEENDLIGGLFDRLKTISPATKDPEAEQLIQRRIASLPDAPYFLVQTLLVQEHALQNAQLRINQLQQQLSAAAAQGQPASSGGGFLSGLFHRGQSSTPPPLPTYPTTGAMAPSAGGGFLRSALTTAAGVAGGSLLFQGIEDLLGHRAGAFGSMLGGYGGGGGFGGINPAENVEVVNNYYGGQDSPSSLGNSFLQTGAEGSDQSFLGADPGVNTAPDPGLGVDWGSNIDPGPGPDPGSIDTGGGSDPGSMAV